MGNRFQQTKLSRWLVLIIGAVILGIIILGIMSGVIQKWLWMQQLNYAGIFWTILSVKWQMFFLAFLVVFLYLGINLHLASKKGAVSHGGRGSCPQGNPGKGWLPVNHSPVGWAGFKRLRPSAILTRGGSGRLDK